MPRHGCECVDGRGTSSVYWVALKFAVDRWSASAEGTRTAALESAYAIRQIEVGLASLMGLFFGLTVLLYGIALTLCPAAQRWLGVFAVLAGVATMISNVVQAHTGFSDTAMAMKERNAGLNNLR